MSRHSAHLVTRNKPNKGGASSKFPAFLCFRSSEIVFECHIKELGQRNGIQYYNLRIIAIIKTETEPRELTLDFNELELIKILRTLDSFRYE